VPRLQPPPGWRISDIGGIDVERKLAIRGQAGYYIDDD
jgi:hypothetical protein